MGFFKYCEKVEGCAGLPTVLCNIKSVYSCWTENKTVGECAKFLQNPVIVIREGGPVYDKTVVR